MTPDVEPGGDLSPSDRHQTSPPPRSARSPTRSPDAATLSGGGGTVVHVDANDREQLLDEVDLQNPMFRDRQGRPISLREHLRLHADPGYRFLARVHVNDWEVVTAWLGLDQGDSDPGQPPLIFGTAALLPDGRQLEGRETFASTEDEALANH